MRREGYFLTLFLLHGKVLEYKIMENSTVMENLILFKVNPFYFVFSKCSLILFQILAVTAQARGV